MSDARDIPSGARDRGKNDSDGHTARRQGSGESTQSTGGVSLSSFGSRSSLGDKHPDHPTLKDLGLDLSKDKEKETNGVDEVDHASASSSSQGPPTLTATPESATSAMGDHASSPEPGSLAAQTQTFGRGGHVLSDGNARSKTVTVAEGENTFGVLNRHPGGAPASSSFSFRVGVAEDRNRRCRRTMEDAHSFVYDFAGIKGQGYFAVFDGHAGKHAAEWCGQNFHEYLLDAVLTYPDQPIPDLLNQTFHTVDARLSHLAHTGKTSSGSTAAVALLRCEKVQEDEPKGFINPQLEPRGLMEGRGEEELEAQTSAASGIDPDRRGSMGGGTGMMGGTAVNAGGSSPAVQRKHSGKRLRAFVRGLTGTEKRENSTPDESTTNVASPTVLDGEEEEDGNAGIEAIEADNGGGAIRRVLYTANVGDARAVLCRKGRAVRLTYDHKGSDPQEAKRITDAGGFVMNNRVNGVLAVTRSLGDASVKEFVVGSPYTTETALDENDEFLIVACDGLWDVCDDQRAVELIRNISDPQEAAKRLLDHAMTNYSTDNLSVMVIRFSHK